MISALDVSEWFRKLQIEISGELEKIDGSEKFLEDEWFRPGGGGGFSKILKGGTVIEKGGVNFSSVHGESPEFLKKSYSSDQNNKDHFFATGVSIVIHPVNPEVPIIHMNIRYFEMGNKKWFGGGIDLTPHYIRIEDAVFFHTELKKMCDKHNPGYYEEFKKEADDYFFIPHRNETRGIGGIFFDRMGESSSESFDNIFEFIKSTGLIFIPIYGELIKRNKDIAFDENKKKWQSLRRGRYVEFNLVYDKGTRFGLETNGRTESILMSLPPMATWEYDYKPETGSREESTLLMLKKGIVWIKK